LILFNTIPPKCALPKISIHNETNWHDHFTFRPCDFLSLLWVPFRYFG